jgi:hypothetical protein
MTRIMIIMGLFLVGCSKPTTTETSSKDSLVAYDSSFNGTWTDGSNNVGLFIIKSDSIHDIKNKETTWFTRKGDSIMFHHTDYVHRAKMYKIHADTLLYEEDSTKIKFWRVLPK